MTRVSIQGEEGAFSHAAAQQLLGAEIELRACRTFDEAFETVLRGEVDRAVIPVENSLAGPVVESLDLLWASGLRVVGETRVRIRLCLSAAPGVRLEDVRMVASHPVALKQCKGLFQEHPRMESVVVYDTAGSVRDLMKGDAGYDAAIGSLLAADLYGAEVLRDGVEDDDRNYTRFFELAAPDSEVHDDGDSAAVAAVIRNEPGGLHEVMGVFAGHGVDMTQIVARPIKGAPWQYRFYMEVRTDRPENLTECLRVLDNVAVETRVFGIYSRFEEAGAG
jgi:prephenate dehydratase